MNVNRFTRTRADHRQEAAEDYVELIDSLIEERGAARTVDIAQRLSISPVTVSKTLKRLDREGYVIAERYKSVQLTPKGAEAAQRSRQRHEIVLNHLLELGVSRETAETDAEGIEHHVSEETLDAMRRWARKSES